MLKVEYMYRYIIQINVLDFMQRYVSIVIKCTGINSEVW